MTNVAISILPVAVLVFMLTVVKSAAWKAALAALAVGSIEAIAFNGLSLQDIARCTMNGTATGLFPIGLIIVAALFTYAVTVESGAVDEIKSGLKKLSSDDRFFVLLTAWGFGNFMEGMAGFGTAVAIPCAILVGAGFDPVKAVLCCLVANTTPTAFASAGVPTMVLATETGLEISPLTRMIAVLQLLVSALSPIIILFIADGWRGLKEKFLLALLAAAAFIVPWLTLAATAGCELPNIVGGISAMVAMALAGDFRKLDAKRQAWAWMPFGFVVATLGAAALIDSRHLVSPGFLIIAAAFAGGLCQRVSAGRLVALLGGTCRKYYIALLTICLVLALAKVMGKSGMTSCLANALVSATGDAYAAVSSIVGALGGFVTGSGTSSNVLFGSLQASIGNTEFEKLLFAAANIMGAGIGKMICPQSIVLGCAAAGLAGRESEMMRKIAPYFLAVIAIASASTIALAHWN